MLPFRRREFEVDALAFEIVRRAARHRHVSWGSVLPRLPGVDAAALNASRHIHLVASASRRSMQIEAELRSTMLGLCPRLSWSWTHANSAEQKGQLETASHVLVLLDRVSNGVLKPGSLSRAELERAVAKEELDGNIVFLYLEPTAGQAGGWDFGAFYKLPPSDLKASIAAQEGLKYRFRSPISMRYEHDALAVEILGRMRADDAEEEQDEEEAYRASVDQAAGPGRARGDVVVNVPEQKSARSRPKKRQVAKRSVVLPVERGARGRAVVRGPIAATASTATQRQPLREPLENAPPPPPVPATLMQKQTSARSEMVAENFELAQDAIIQSFVQPAGRSAPVLSPQRQYKSAVL